MQKAIKSMVISSLFFFGSGICQPGSWSEWALVNASGYGYPGAVSSLLYLGVDPNKEVSNTTALIEASRYGQLEVAKKLLPFVSIDTEVYGKTALQCAARNRRVEMTKLLLDHGADADIGICLRAAEYNNEDIVKLFLSRGTLPGEEEIGKAVSEMLKASYRESSSQPQESILGMPIQDSAAIHQAVGGAIMSGRVVMPLSDEGKALIAKHRGLYDRHVSQTQKALTEAAVMSQDSEGIVLSILYGE